MCQDDIRQAMGPAWLISRYFLYKFSEKQFELNKNLFETG